jgi:hypothetical protein
MKKPAKKLALASETVRNIAQLELPAIRGGRITASDICSQSECKTSYTCWFCAPTIG